MDKKFDGYAGVDNEEILGGYPMVDSGEELIILNDADVIPTKYTKNLMEWGKLDTTNILKNLQLEINIPDIPNFNSPQNDYSEKLEIQKIVSDEIIAGYQKQIDEINERTIKNLNK